MPSCSRGVEVDAFPDALGLLVGEEAPRAERPAGAAAGQGGRPSAE